MHFLYKCRVCEQIFTSPDFPHLGQGPAAEAVRELLNNPNEGYIATRKPSGRNDQRMLYRELICEHPDGSGIADLQGTSRDEIKPPITNLAPE